MKVSKIKNDRMKICKIKKITKQSILDSTDQNMLTEMVVVELKCFILLHKSYQIVPIEKNIYLFIST